MSLSKFYDRAESLRMRRARRLPASAKMHFPGCSWVPEEVASGLFRSTRLSGSSFLSALCGLRRAVALTQCDREAQGCPR